MACDELEEQGSCTSGKGAGKGAFTPLDWAVSDLELVAGDLPKAAATSLQLILPGNFRVDRQKLSPVLWGWVAVKIV